LFALPDNTSGFTSVSPVCSAAIGYRQTVNYLLQDNYQFENIEQFMAYLKSFTTSTRNYAKHQLHWYRNQNSFLWLHPRGMSNDNMEEVTKELNHWMQVPREEYQDMLSQQVIS
jgi:tRNA A37 N6-isopentenylltransferase MiaA